MPVLAPETPAVINVPNTFIAPILDHGWNVILHNDDAIAFNTVTYALQVVLGYDEYKAGSIMWEAHTQGKASVIVTTETLAKHYKERLESFQLTITIEQL